MKSDRLPSITSEFRKLWKAGEGKTRGICELQLRKASQSKELRIYEPDHSPSSQRLSFALSFHSHRFRNSRLPRVSKNFLLKNKCFKGKNRSPYWSRERSLVFISCSEARKTSGRRFVWSKWFRRNRITDKKKHRMPLRRSILGLAVVFFHSP